MKKNKEYKSVMNDKVGIRINGNESCKNIEKNDSRIQKKDIDGLF